MIARVVVTEQGSWKMHKVVTVISFVLFFPHAALAYFTSAVAIFISGAGLISLIPQRLIGNVFIFPNRLSRVPDRRRLEIYLSAVGLLGKRG
jgi:hypothetical protein